MRLSGAAITAECLKERGVTRVFGYPGAAVLDIYDALYDNRPHITHYLTAHEQGAAHAADGYARATGKTGVCIATSGPGATNLVTGIAAAYMDSIPMVAITGNVGRALLGKDSFQEVDIAGVTIPVSKYNFIVKEPARVADTLRRAFAIAESGRPGPVLVDITKDAAEGLCEYAYQTPAPISHPSVDQQNLLNAARLIDGARRPLVYAGGGCITSGASLELRAFAERIDAPVCLSMMGLGAYPASDGRCTGMAGVYGSAASRAALNGCDVLIAAGARFSERVTGYAKRFAPNAKIVHLDIDPAEIGKNVATDAYVTGDLKQILNALNDTVKTADHSDWLDYIHGVKQSKPFTYKRGKTLRAEYILQRLGAIAGPQSIIVTDVGVHQILTCRYVPREEPRTLIASGGLGAMGFGLPAAAGAQAGRPGATVVCVTGDGGFRMSAPELATLAGYCLPVVVLIINDSGLGMVRRLQDELYGGRRCATDLPGAVDYVKLAESYGVEAARLTQAKDTDAALARALASRKPYVIDCVVSYD